ncbi:MAG: amidohydrolase family protein [Brevundimonas sp.]
MLGLLMTVALGLADTSPPPQTIYEGGEVWTGSGFTRGAVVVEGDRIVARGQARPDAHRVSVAGRYLTPAYGNAHAHVTPATPEASRRYTDAGVFYVWNPNTVVLGPDAKAFWARPDAYDVRVSQGGITEPGGHPERLYVEILAGPVYGGRPREWFVGNAFHYGATPAEIDAALDLLVSQGADFVKAYLLDSEHYAELRDDPDAYGRKGLNPENMPYLVAAAHARGLFVVVHVETAHDIAVAARAGADVAGHLPGYAATTEAELAGARLTPEIATLVAAAGMQVIPTYALIRGDAYDAETALSADLANVAAVQRENLRLLRVAGVKVLMGTDGFGPVWTEAEHLVEIGAMTSAEAATMVLSTGARLFPERRIGCLDPGCEADFLILDADPTQDIRALRRIAGRVMQGAALPGPEDR